MIKCYKFTLFTLFWSKFSKNNPNFTRFSPKYKNHNFYLQKCFISITNLLPLKWHSDDSQLLKNQNHNSQVKIRSTCTFSLHVAHFKISSTLEIDSKINIFKKSSDRLQIDQKNIGCVSFENSSICHLYTKLSVNHLYFIHIFENRVKTINFNF